VRAIEWLTALASQQAVVVSPQILNESMRLFLDKLNVSPSDLLPVVHSLAPWCTASVDPPVTERALEVRERWKFGWWDCLIVASALRAGCQALLTEDLQDGQQLDGLTVVNPFLHEPSSILTAI